MPVVISTARWLCLMFINAYTVWTQARVVWQRVHHLFQNDSDVHAAWLLISSFDILELLIEMLHENKWCIAACALFHVMWNAERISDGCIMLYSFDWLIFPPYNSLTEVCVVLLIVFQRYAIQCLDDNTFNELKPTFSRLCTVLLIKERRFVLLPYSEASYAAGGTHEEILH